MSRAEWTLIAAMLYGILLTVCGVLLGKRLAKYQPPEVDPEIIAQLQRR